jgi:hypothetical protein
MPVYIDTVYRRVRTSENKASNNYFSMASFSIYTVYHEEPVENNEISSLHIWIRNRLLSVQYVCVEGMEGGDLLHNPVPEYQNVCLIVGIGSPTPSPASECVSPLDPKWGGQHTILRVRGWRGPSRTTG